MTHTAPRSIPVQQIRNELLELQQRETRLAQEISQRDAILREALTVEPRFFKDGDASEARERKAASADQLTHLRERMATLESLLPSVDDVRHAESELPALTDEAIHANQECER